MKSFGVRINLLIIMLILSLIAIAPKFNVEGVEVKSLDVIGKNQGLTVGEIIKSVDSVDVKSPEQFIDLLK